MAPGLIQSPRTISAPADRGDDDVGAADDCRQVAGARVGDGDRRALAEQEHAPSACRRCWSGRSPRRRAPARSPSSGLSRCRQPSGVHGTSDGSPVARRPAFTGWKPSTSLAGSIVSMTRVASICLGSGSWTRMPSTALVGVERDRPGRAARPRSSYRAGCARSWPSRPRRSPGSWSGRRPRSPGPRRRGRWRARGRGRRCARTRATPAATASRIAAAAAFPSIRLRRHPP